MPASPLALRIAMDITHKIEAGDLVPGAHLATETLAQEYQVSRSPIREALGILSERGFIESRRNRGCFIRGSSAEGGSIPVLLQKDTGEQDPYFLFAEDWLNDRIESEVTELAIRERYTLTKTQAQEILIRAAREGWAEPKPGYGWRLLPVAKTPEAFEQIYRFRAVIEPAALLEVSFRFDRAAAAGLRKTQERLAAGQIDKLPLEALTAAGATFHEELIRMSGNPMYFQALARANQLRRLAEYRLKVNPSRVIIQSTQHLEMLDLLEQGDNLEAAHLMRRHLSGALAAKSPVIHPRIE